MQPPQIVT